MRASCCAWMRELRNWRSKTGFKKNSKTENSKTQPSFCVELIIRESVKHDRERESIGWKRIIVFIGSKRGCCLHWLGALSESNSAHEEKINSSSIMMVLSHTHAVLNAMTKVKIVLTWAGWHVYHLDIYDRNRPPSWSSVRLQYTSIIYYAN